MIPYAPTSWNPVVGCTPVSEGCEKCWAANLHNRRYMSNREQARFLYEGRSGLDAIREARRNGNKLPFPPQYDVPFAKVQLLPDRLEEPLHWSKPRTVSVCFMGDLWHPEVPDEFIDQVFGIMALTSAHTYLVLTKRPARMRDYIANAYHRVRHDTEEGVAHRLRWETSTTRQKWDLQKRWWTDLPPKKWPLPNVWLGVTAENQHWADERIPLLLDTPGKHWVSLEPLLGPVDLGRWLHVGRCRSVGPPPDMFRCGDRARHGGEHTALVETGAAWFGHPPLDWVVLGGESGPGHRPMPLEWAKDIADQCTAARVPFYFKQRAATRPGQPSGVPMLDTCKETPWEQ